MRITFILISFLFLSSTVFAQSLSDSLVAYYPFNGNALDASGNGLDGIAFGAQLTADRFGNSNSAYIFDGVDDYIFMGDRDEFDFGANQDFTISVWVYPASIQSTPTGTTYSIIEKWENNSGSNNPPYPFAIRLGESAWNGGTIRCVINDKTCNNLTVGDALTNILDDQFHHVVFRVQQNVGNIFIDNNLESIFLNVSTCPPTNSNPFQVGKRAGSINNAYFTGVIDDIRIYNRALSTDQIDSLFQGITSLEENVFTQQNSYFNRSLNSVEFKTDVKSELKEYILFDIHGRKIANGKTFENSLNLNSIIQTNQIYFLRAVGESGKNYSLKFIN